MPQIVITPRDTAILVTLFEYDGILSVSQVHRWFFGHMRNAQRRISLLHQHGYLARITRQQRHLVPEPVVWLARRGAQAVASHRDVPFADLPWRRQPHWSKVAHDIALNEFRHTFTLAASTHARFELESWYGQDEVIRMFPSPIRYRNHLGQRLQRRVQPDGILSLLTRDTSPHRIRFLVEFDNSTESISRFARDKVYPGVQFVHSPTYVDTFQTRVPGRFLVVVNGSERRFHNMRADVAKAGGAQYFLFTQAAWVTPETALRGEIWWLPHIDTPFSLETYDTPEFQRYLAHSAAGLATPKLL